MYGNFFPNLRSIISEKCLVTQFSFWILIAHANIYFFHIVISRAKILLYLWANSLRKLNITRCAKRMRSNKRRRRPQGNEVKASAVIKITLSTRAFSHARSCTQSVLNRYCKTSVPVPTEDRFNPFCHDLEPQVDFQASKRSTNETNQASRPKHPVANRAPKNSKVLSRLLSVAVGVVNLTTAVRGIGLN